MSEKQPTATVAPTEKPLGEVNIDVREASTANSHKEHDLENCAHIQWETGFWKRFPWIGFMAIVTMLVCIALDGLILGTSDGRSAEEWPAYQKWHFIDRKWRKKAQIEPHVLLALVNTLTNVCLTIAIGHGVAIAWWRRVLSGSTIADLHKSWGMASSVLELLTAGKKFNYIALAALMAKIALIDNVLLQRAASTVPGWHSQRDMNVTIPMARTLPPYYAGVASEDGKTIAVSAAFSWDVYGYLNDSLIHPDYLWQIAHPDPYDTGCIGICDSVFTGFGFKWDCTDANYSVKYDITRELARANSVTNMQSLIDAENREITDNGTASASTMAQLTAIGTNPLYSNPLLEVTARFVAAGMPMDDDYSWHYSLPPSVRDKTLDVGSIALMLRWTQAQYNEADPTFCPNSRTIDRFCSLTPAVVDYGIRITNVTKHGEDDAAPSAEYGISLISNPDADFYHEDGSRKDPYVNGSESLVDGQWDGYRVQGPAYTPYTTDYDSNLREIASFLSNNFESAVVLESVNVTGREEVYAPNPNAFSGLSGIPTTNLFGSYWIQKDPSSSCAIEVQEPTYFIAQRLNNLMVRASLRAATSYTFEDDNVGLVRPEMIQWRKQSQLLASVIYRTNWAFGAAAMATIFVCVLCVLPSYWGFWQLGRKVTLGPIEVAGAFQAPVMDHPAVATHGEVDEFVKEIGDRRVRYGQVEGQQRLGVAPPAEVTRPRA